LLNDLHNLEEIDKGNMRRLLFEFPEQCQKAAKLGENLPLSKELLRDKDRLVICGLGGSAIGGDILKTLLSQRVKISISVNRNYGLPAWVNDKTLVFALSYSGNTEETLASYEEAVKRECSIVCISSGGRLNELAGKDGIPSVLVPSGMPPRTAIGYLFIPMLRALEKLTLIEEQNYEELIGVLEGIRDKCAPDVPVNENMARLISRELIGKIPLVYGVDGKTDVVAHRLKTQFNENSKVLAFWDVFPELNHNEVVAWGGEGRINLKAFYPLFIRDRKEGDKVKRRIEVTQSIIERQGLKYGEIWTEGESLLSRILSAIYIGDWISFYLAILQEVDPTPVRAIDFLKRELSKL